MQETARAAATLKKKVKSGNIVTLLQNNLESHAY